MIDATHLEALGTAAHRLKKGDVPHHIGCCSKGSLNSKLHGVCDKIDKSIWPLLSKAG